MHEKKTKKKWSGIYYIFFLHLNFISAAPNHGNVFSLKYFSDGVNDRAGAGFSSRRIRKYMSVYQKTNLFRLMEASRSWPSTENRENEIKNGQLKTNESKSLPTGPDVRLNYPLRM